MLKTTSKTQLGKEIHHLAKKLNQLKQNKRSVKPEERPAFNKTYKQVKEELHKAQTELRILNGAPPLPTPKSKKKPPAYYYWFFIAAKQYLPNKVLKAIEELAMELLTKHINP